MQKCEYCDSTALKTFTLTLKDKRIMNYSCEDCGYEWGHDINFTKVLVGYSTNRNDFFIKRFNKEIKDSIGCEHTIVPVFNDGSMSLTQVYNSIWDSIEDYDDTLFVFIHHDIHFKTMGWGKNLINIFNKNDVDILGLAGTSTLHPHCVWWLDENNIFNTKDLWGKVWHTDGKKEWKTDFTTHNKKCEKVQPVVAIDGVFIAFNPNNCSQFNEEIDNFHFYDISFCIENFVDNRVIAVTETIAITHESGGKLSPEWEANRLKVQEIYKQYKP